MKRKISRILGVGLSLALLTSLMFAAVPVSARDLLWYPDEVSLLTLGYTDTVIGTDIADLAVNGDTVYAAIAGQAHPVVWILTEAPTGAGTDADFTVTYTNQDGVEGRTAEVFSIAADAIPGLDWIDGLQLAEGDTGVRDITNVTMDGWASATEGMVVFIDFGSVVTYIETGVLEPEVGYGAAVVNPGAPGTLLPYFMTDGATPVDVAWKSTAAGDLGSWADLSTTIDYPEDEDIKLLAVAPDDADVVAMVTEGDEVYYSIDGGANWDNLGNPTDGDAVINAIDISPETAGYNYVAAGGSDGTGNAELYTLKLAMAEAWEPRVDTGAGFAAAQTDIVAVQFSPNFDVDKVITCVSWNANVEEVAYFQMFRHEEGAYTWNGEITFATDWETGRRISEDDLQGDIDPLDGLPAASIALPDSYLGNDEGERIAFVGLAGATSGGGAVRLVDTYLMGLTTWAAGAEGPIYSLAYQDEKLMAGTNDGQVYRSLDPMATYPRFERLNTFKQPGGDGNVVVAWAGDKVLAGTSGDESAFATSTDDGYAFNDIYWVDTDAGFSGDLRNGAATDVAVSADGYTIYLATYEADDASLWLSTTGGYSWSRVLSLMDIGADADNLIIRLAPDDASVVYLADKGSKNMWVSTDSGMGRWKEIDCYKLDKIQDFVVESADIVYAIDTTGCTKTKNAGASWGDKVGLEGVIGNMITLAGEDVVVAGSGGYIAYSVDGGATFTKQSLPVKSPGNTLVVADSDYETNGIIYAAGAGTTGPSVSRGKLEAIGIEWDGIGPDPDDLPTNTDDYYGLACYEGVLYALSCNGTASVLWRTLHAQTAETAVLAEWSSYKSTAELEGNIEQPQVLRLSSGPKLWAVSASSPPVEELPDLTVSVLYSLGDPIALEGPALIAPEDGFSVKVNPANGKAYNLTFSFERYSSKYLTGCQLQIATDADFDAVVYNVTFTGIVTDVISKVIGPSGTQAVETPPEPTHMCDFMPGTTYYWRVRAALGEPAYSLWSEVRSFTVAEAEPTVITITEPAEPAEVVTVEIPVPVEAAPVFEVLSPEAGAMSVTLQPTFVWSAYEGATTYEIMTSEYADFSILEWSHTCDRNFYAADEPFAYETLYYWRVRASEPEEGPWAQGIFTTEAKPVPLEPTVITITETLPPEIVEVEVPAPAEAAIPDYLLWTIVGIGAVLVISVIVLIVRTRRVA